MEFHGVATVWIGHSVTQACIQKRCTISAKALEKTPGRRVVLSRGSLTQSFKRSRVVPTSDDAWVWSQELIFEGSRRARSGGILRSLRSFFDSHEWTRLGAMPFRLCQRGIGAPRPPVPWRKWDLPSDDTKQIVRLRDGETFSICDH